MNRRKAVLFALCAGAALSGCEGDQSRWLTERQHQLDFALTERSEIAQSLNERRRELDGLEEKLAELKARQKRPSAEDLDRLLAGHGPKTVTFNEEKGSLNVHLDGTGGVTGLMAALRALAPAERAIVLEQVSVGPRAWSAELVVPAEPPPPAQELPTLGVPAIPRSTMPDAGIVESLFRHNRLVQRRSWVAMTEQRIAALDKVVSEVVRLHQRKAGLEAEMSALKEPRPGNRLVGQRTLIEALFGGMKPRITTGTVELQGDQLTLKGLGPGDVAKRLESLAGLGRVLQSGPDAIVISTAGQE